MIHGQRDFLRAPMPKNLAHPRGGNSLGTDAKGNTLRSAAPTTPCRPPAVMPEGELPVENSLACDATLAPDDSSAWHDATVAPPATVAANATVAPCTMVKGELRVPNTLNFSLFPTLDPFAKAVYYQLFLLSHGFRRDTCVVSLEKLANSILMSQRKVQNTITYLERRGLVIRLRPMLGGSLKGCVYRVRIPATDAAPAPTAGGNVTLAPDATHAPDATVAPRANNKYDDDDLKENHHQRALKGVPIPASVENHSGAAAPRERHECAVQTAYERLTGNRWNKADSASYSEHELDQVPVEKINSVLEAVTRRTPFKINSFKYFIKEIKAKPDPRNRAWQKRQLEEIVRRIKDNSVGRANYSGPDFLEDVKLACAREGVVFTDDIYNELVP
jgi:hypothetical protein